MRFSKIKESLKIFSSVQNQDVYLEAQIENTSNGNMFMERVELEPSQHYKVSSVTKK